MQQLDDYVWCGSQQQQAGIKISFAWRLLKKFIWHFHFVLLFFFFILGVKYNSIANSYRCDMERNYFILIGVMELPLFDHMLSAALGTSCPKKGQHWLVHSGGSAHSWSCNHSDIWASQKDVLLELMTRVK